MTTMQSTILALAGIGDNYNVSLTRDGRPHVLTERGVSIIPTAHGVELWRPDWEDAVRVSNAADALRIVIADALAE